MTTRDRRNQALESGLRRAILSTCALVPLGFTLLGCPLVVGLDKFEHAPEDNACLQEALPLPPGKADLLLVLDNSRSMSAKQDLLANALPLLIAELVNPPCIDAAGTLAEVASPADSCPPGAKRVIIPLRDLHIGILTSSLGGLGSDACSVAQSVTNDDRGHLIARMDPQTLDPVPTYQGLGFLAWDPSQSLSPAGTTALPDLIDPLTKMVTGAGAIGCGYASLLEAPYRFLIDPEPYDHIEIVAGQAVLKGTDTTLLDQRKAFLRPDSVLVVTLLSDANDCSIKAGDQNYLVAQAKVPLGTLFHLPRPRAICAEKPDDMCCYSCGQIGPTDEQGNPLCPDDSSCLENSGTLTDTEDPLQLRCFDQKRRFGVDFLYPIDRYTQGFTQPQITDRFGQVVPNPIFSDLDPNDEIAAVRTPEQVVVAGIVGVPWQDIARVSSEGTPDLAAGLDQNGNPLGGFMLWEELSAKDAMGRTRWDMLLGDPAAGTEPLDPFMRESIDQRTGQNPITGDPIVQSGAGPDNAINGHEQALPQRDNLQLACVFSLETPIDCSVFDPLVSCDCEDFTNDSPLCAPNPQDGDKRTLQVKAGAWPAARPLSLLRSLGPQGIVASICPPDKGDVATAYRSALAGIGQRVSGKLGAQCIDSVLAPDASTNEVPCVLLEARHTENEATCDCPSPARSVPSEASAVAVDAAKKSLRPDLNCLCEIAQTKGDALSVCKNNISDLPRVNGELVHGFCYLDGPAKIGAPELVQDCPTERQIRLVGAASPIEGSSLFLHCTSAPECNIP